MCGRREGAGREREREGGDRLPGGGQSGAETAARQREGARLSLRAAGRGRGLSRGEWGGGRRRRAGEGWGAASFTATNIQSLSRLPAHHVLRTVRIFRSIASPQLA
eukprot:5201682-Alexandrium_andersonii.AAC.1